MFEDDPYRILGLRPGAPLDEVRRAYLAAARDNHPDRLIDADDATRAAAEERMRLVNEAWAVLSDPSARPLLPRPAARSYVRPEPVEPDRDELDDTGQPPSWLARRITGLGPLLFVAGFLTGLLGAMVGSIPMVAIAFLMVVLAAACFLMAPFLVMAGARRNDR